MEQEVKQDKSQEPESPAESQGEKQKHTRRSRKSLIGQIEDALFACAKELEKEGIKPARSSLLQARLETLRYLQVRKDAEQRNAAIQENVVLKSQHEAQTAEIAMLRQKAAQLESKKLEEVREIAVDPEAAALREQNAALTVLVKHIASHYDTEAERAEAAIRVITSCPPIVAKIFCDCVGVEYSSYAQMLSVYKTESQLQSVIDRAQREGPAVVFARAAIAVRDAETAKRMITVPGRLGSADTRTVQEKIRAAKELVYPGRTPRFFPPSIQTAEENLRSQPREIVGSPDAIPYRERITPIFAGAVTRSKEISGGGEFGPWV